MYLFCMNFPFLYECFIRLKVKYQSQSALRMFMVAVLRLQKWSIDLFTKTKSMNEQRRKQIDGNLYLQSEIRLLSFVCGCCSFSLSLCSSKSYNWSLLWTFSSASTICELGNPKFFVIDFLPPSISLLFLLCELYFLPLTDEADF